ncbi:sodium/proton antiporter, NhaD family (TC 2.A.62) [Thiothrix caldifontis]|uniref:Sodium/proton antiporter, NhaD family (TC 2.A.62) n=1 Tax=Thiothrix caldifontis TaxID=525918 RepID=A0A1H4EQ93_9GAMM|nr:sodium:proton antiporter NhaD [Thiothrix caldifontis]SEA86700.1 sodium/proton antiporter, NhaD family (TC 2.A.62) [Thiothrix caldifontis]
MKSTFPLACFTGLMTLLLPALSFASGSGGTEVVNLTATALGLTALILFIFAYGLVIGEEHLHMRKSKPVIVAAGIIWVLVAIAYTSAGRQEQMSEILNHNLLEYGQLFLFLLAAMTFINTLEERNMFAALRSWLVSRGFSLYWIFWITGLMAFFISPIADNLTTALLMAAVLMAVAADKPAFVAMGCINIVVAANAGGAWSPFGDITTLMVWQAGIVKFQEFFALFVPSVLNWLVPAFIMSFFIEKGKPAAMKDVVTIKRGGFVVLGLFIATIATAVMFHNSLHLPPVLGMMTGLGVLQVFGWYLKMSDHDPSNDNEEGVGRFDIYNQLQRSEWDTLMFFYGVILCVGGLGAFGYLALVSEVLYTDMGATWANVMIGLLSAVVDNIPVMFAVITMHPEMSHGQWLLVTLTAGVGGSLLSIGSAAGVALMGQARGIYTFMSHLKWTWAVALGYVISIWIHLWINAAVM